MVERNASSNTLLLRTITTLSIKKEQKALKRSISKVSRGNNKIT